MNYYKVLGIEENASKEEIRQAYCNQVNKFKEEVKDQKRLEKFLNLFKEAYDALNCEENEEKAGNVFDEDVSSLFKNVNVEKKVENTITSDNDDINNSYAATVLMNREDILKEAILNSNNDDSKEDFIFKSKEDFEENEELFYDDGYEERIIRSNKRKKKSKSKNKKKNTKKKDNVDKDEREYNSKDRDRDRNQDREMQRGGQRQRTVVRKENNKSSIINMLMIPLKILALPIIAILSLIIFICKIISLASWLVSKAIIIGAIGISAIHGYQIYTGQALVNYKLFIVCGIGAVVSFFLPSIVKMVPGILQGINNTLKNFVF